MVLNLKFGTSWIFLWILYIFISLENSATEVWGVVTWYVVYKLNKMGEDVVPQGTSAIIGVNYDISEPTMVI